MEAWLELTGAGEFEGPGDYRTSKPCVRQRFRKYLECGIFAQVAGDADAHEQASFPGRIFRSVTGMNTDVLLQVQARLSRLTLNAFGARGLRVSDEAKEMLADRYSGFSVDTSVCE